MIEQPQHVVLLIADSLRYDSVYTAGIGMPYMQKKGIQFTQARASGCWTLPGTASLFTGLLPHEHGATSQTRKIDPNVPTLAEKLKSVGYATHQVTANVVTTDIFGLNRGFDEVKRIWKHVDAKYNMLQQFLVLFGKPRLRKMLLSKDALMHKMSEDLEANKTWLQHTHQDIFKSAKQILNENDRQKKKTFLFLNLMESHFPYHIAPQFQTLSKGIFDKLREIKSLYHALNQTFLTKENPLTQKWMDLLKERQQLAWKSLAKSIDDFAQELHEDKNVLFIFAADHGDNFGDQSWVYHFSNVTDAGTKVPLFVLKPNAENGKTIDTPVSSRDIHHTILRHCNYKDYTHDITETPDDSFSIMQSYWYNNHGKTLPEYLYNQMAFVKDDMRYLSRKNQWYSAPITTGISLEDDFKPLPTDANPIEDLTIDLARKQQLQNWFTQFNEFSNKVLPKG